MHSSAVFFGGLTMGGILAAACGFDLFPEERGERRALEEARVEVKELKASLTRSQEILRRAEARGIALESQAEEHASRAAAGAGQREHIARLTAENDDLRAEAARLGAELLAARTAQQAAQAEIRQLRHSALEQILDFFAVERGAVDAGLVTRFLAASADKDEQQALILELLKRNKHLLLAMPTDPEAWFAAVEEATAHEAGGLGKASAREPAPANPGGAEGQ